MRKRSAILIVAIILSNLFLINVSTAQAAVDFASPLFRSVWERPDKILTERPNVGRGFVWGPDSIFAGREEYAEGIGKRRTIQYFDKGRMESGSSGVTSGLLVKELVLGRMQIGDEVNNYVQGKPSEVQIAGDPNTGGANAVSPTYSSFKNIATFNNDNPIENKVGQPANQGIDKAGNINPISSPDPSVILSNYEAATKHNIANVFVSYGNTQGLIWNGIDYVNGALFAPNAITIFGLPITDPYWVKAVVGGQEKDILIQLFERRVLTYTPSNDPSNKVEMGNVGQHYYRWRYSENLGLGNPNPYNYTGKGDKVFQNINLRGGLIRSASTHSGKTNFIVTLLDKDGKNKELITNEIGTYQGGKYFLVESSSNYTINIKADGDWKVELFDAPAVANEPVLPQSNKYSGKGNITLKVNLPKTGLTVFKTSHNGKGYFGIIGYPNNGTSQELIANEIGSYTGEKAVKVETLVYYVSVQADGDWTIEIS